jgi:hypothetical protein
VRAFEVICSRSGTALMPKLDFGVYISGCAATMPAWNVLSSAARASSSTFGASRPKISVIRCSRPVTIVADR